MLFKKTSRKSKSTTKMASASKILTYITMGTAATAAASLSNNNNNNNIAYAFYPFTSSSSPSKSTPKDDQTASSDHKSSDTTQSDAASDEPRGAGMDPELLERGAKALRKINNNPNSKLVFEVMRHQEKSRQAELAAEKVQYEAVQSQLDIDKQRKRGEEHRELVQKQAQGKAQNMRYEDELARKRMQTDHEAQRRHNVELVKMQEESSIRKEQARRVTEEQVQAQRRRTEKERAEIERETLRHNAIAEAEARAHEAKLTEEQNRRLLVEQMNGEKDKWLAAINTSFGHIEGGLRMLLTDRSKLIMTVGGATALAAGVYTSREGARVTWGYINRILGQPSLIRESSMARYPMSGTISRAMSTLKNKSKAGPVSELKASLGNVILHPSLQKRIELLARATANTKAHQAPFRNMLFYGPPGTGKTMVAREIARKSGLDYAMMTGGDVAPLGAQAVTKIHEIFDWAKKSKKGLLLFIDKADAFLCERNSIHMSEAQRSALNALLFRTGDQSRDIVLVLATNRPEDLDSAITDRIDEVLEFPLPGEEERFKLVKLYLNKYLVNQTETTSVSGLLFKSQPQRITIKEDVSDDLIREVARKIDGFSGREIAKLIASVQAAVYGRPDCVLDSQLFMEVVDYKIVEHHQRIKLAAEGVQPQTI